MNRFSGLLLFLILCSAGRVNSQMNILFQSQLYGRTVDGLGVFQVQNFTGAALVGRIVITASENTTNSPVVTITTPEVGFATGSSLFQSNFFKASAFNFASNAFGRIAGQTRGFPAGEYTICYKFISSDKQGGNDFETCFDVSVEPLVPITLVSPADQDSICQKRPFLAWQPPLPMQAGTRYRLLLTEKTGKSSTESLLRNLPLLLLDNLTAPSLPFPSAQPELKEGKTYCWQVVAYQQGVISSRSEVWEFAVQCKEAPKPLIQDSYREIKLLTNGNYYLATNYLKFSFNNNYNTNKLVYKIVDLDQGEKPVDHLPEIKISYGLNKIDLDLTELSLTNGGHYLLTVYPFNELPIQLRFTYKEE